MSLWNDNGELNEENGGASVEYDPANFYAPRNSGAGNGGRDPRRGEHGRRAVIAVALAFVIVVVSLLGGVLIGRQTALSSFSTTTTAGQGGGGNTPPIDRGDVSYNVVERENGVPSDGSFPSVVQSAQKSVVEIQTSTTVTDGYFNNYVESGAGSGVLISASGADGQPIKGLILTCDHVISGADANGITVILADGREYSGGQIEVLGQDQWSDLALLRIKNAPADLTYASLAKGAGDASDYSYLTVGETVAAIGNPLGSLGGSVSRGIISALGRNVIIEGFPMTLLQIDASVNPGNSGGGLFNMNGDLIGIVNAKSVGESIEGIGFAIPSSVALEIASSLYTQGYVSGRPYLGLYLAESNSQYLRISSYQFADELTGGDTVMAGDYLETVDGTKITDLATLTAVLATKKPGDTVEVTLLRVQYTTTRITVTLTVHEYVPTA